MPCRRWKITEVVLSKPGNVDVESLQWTHRWKETTAMPEITQWQDSEVKWITLDDGLLAKGVRVKVRRFKWLKGDLTERSWVDEDTKREVKIETEDYALVEVATVKAAYEKYLSDVHSHMLGGAHSKVQLDKFKDLLRSKDGLLWKTYQQARHRRDDPLVTILERELLTKVLDLWVAVRLTTRSFTISGDETLGIPRNKNNKTPIPPVMGSCSLLPLVALQLEILTLVATQVSSWISCFSITP